MSRRTTRDPNFNDRSLGGNLDLIKKRLLDGELDVAADLLSDLIEAIEIRVSRIEEMVERHESSVCLLLDFELKRARGRLNL